MLEATSGSALVTPSHFLSMSVPAQCCGAIFTLGSVLFCAIVRIDVIGQCVRSVSGLHAAPRFTRSERVLVWFYEFLWRVEKFRRGPVCSNVRA